MLSAPLHAATPPISPLFQVPVGAPVKLTVGLTMTLPPKTINATLFTKAIVTDGGVGMDFRPGRPWLPWEVGALHQPLLAMPASTCALAAPPSTRALARVQ